MAVNLDQLYWLVKERVKVLQGFNVKIINALNSNPIVITTESSHQYETGRLVNIDGVKGNQAANGSSYVRVLTPTKFELYKQVNKISNASNTSPIVVTITGHNFNTADNIKIQGVEGNTAANGSFYVKQRGIAISSVVGTPVLLVDNFTNTNPIVVTKTTHGLSTGDRVQITSPSGVASINGVFYVNVLTLNTFELYTDASLTTTVDGTTLGVYEGNWQMQKYSPMTVTATGHGFVNKNPVKIIDVLGEPAAIGGFYVKVLNANTFELYTDKAISIPALSSGTYVSGGIVALQSNYDLELYLDNQLTAPSVGNGTYVRGGLVLSRAAIGNGNYIEGGKVVKEVDIANDFKDTFPEVPSNVYESIVKRVRS